MFNNCSFVSLTKQLFLVSEIYPCQQARNYKVSIVSLLITICIALRYYSSYSMERSSKYTMLAIVKLMRKYFNSSPYVVLRPYSYKIFHTYCKCTYLAFVYLLRKKTALSNLFGIKTDNTLADHNFSSLSQVTGSVPFELLPIPSSCNSLK